MIIEMRYFGSFGLSQLGIFAPTPHTPQNLYKNRIVIIRNIVNMKKVNFISYIFSSFQFIF